jgi:hypothetical protein
MENIGQIGEGLLCGASPQRQPSAYCVEKLLFQDDAKNCRPAEASFLLGRGGPYQLLLRATKGLLTIAPTIRRVNQRLQVSLARNRGQSKLEFFNRIGQLRTLNVTVQAARK